MLAIARISEAGEIVWCSRNWPYLTGFSFLKTIGSNVQELVTGYKLFSHTTEQKITLQDRELYLHSFQLADTHVLILEDRSHLAPTAYVVTGENPEVEGQFQDFLQETERFSIVARQGLKAGKSINNVEHTLLFEELPSSAVQSMIRYTKKVAPTDATVLIMGESGVGKEGIARYIHQLSSRSLKPYVKVNCGAIPENLVESELFGYVQGAFTGAERGGKKGVFEEANTGTLFLDEIGELPLASQVKLLHVVQERSFKKVGDSKTITVDVRIIAATNRDLEKEVALGRFREDLYYRLCVFPVEISPLRERKEDIEPLVRYFLEKVKSKYQVERTLSSDVLHALLHYPWPGNIRQLENVMERLVVTADETELSFFDLPSALRERVYPISVSAPDKGQGVHQKLVSIQQIISLKEATALVEKELLQMAREYSNSTYEIAKMLGVDQSTVSRKLKQYAE